MMFWLNVDYSQRRCTLHTADCTWRQQEETDGKGIGRLLDKGGWLSFQYPEQAHNYYRERWQPQRYAFIRCSNCNV